MAAAIIDLVVTQDDIDNGIPCSHCECPVALAAKRKFGAAASFYPDYGMGWVLLAGQTMFRVVGGPEFAKSFDDEFTRVDCVPRVFELIPINIDE